MLPIHPSVSLLSLGALLCSAVTLAAEDKVVAYVPNWVDLKALAPAIDYPKLTHINIAFENPTNDAGDLSFNAQDDLLIAAAHEHHVKVLVSIGGGAASGDKKLQARYFALTSAQKRAAFAAKLAAYVKSHHFDGLDVDIEGPSINEDYGAFVHELAGAFQADGLLLTAALSKGYGGNKVPDSVFHDFAFVNIMAYDGVGPWNPKAPGQHSSFEFARQNTEYWLGRGLPREKAVLGLPFYGYGFGDAYRKGDYGYSKILDSYPGAEKSDQVGSTIWYNGIPTIKAKTEYARREKLGGVMIWSLDYDVKGERSLLTAIHEVLHAAAPAP